MQKKNVIIRLLLLGSVCLGAVVPITYGRYFDKSEGEGNLVIAKWEIILNDENVDEEIDLDLFKTVDDRHLKNGEKVIAPGVSGNIVLNLKNNSDVVAEGTIELEEIENIQNIPIVYSLEEDGEYVGIEDFEIMSNEEMMPQEERNITIYWKWNFYSSQEQNDKDNELGVEGTELYKLRIDINVNQKVS